MNRLDSSNPIADAAMDRYASGDNAAFGEVYDALAPRLYAFIIAAVRDKARAEDLVQQTMLQIHCARGRFVRGSKVTPWAVTIIRRLFFDQAKRKKLELLTPDGEESTDHPSNRPDPEEFFEAKQREHLVRTELARLSDAQRAAMDLVYYSNMSHAEAAEVLGVTTASVKLRVQRASKIIRAVFGTRHSDEVIR